MKDVVAEQQSSVFRNPDEHYMREVRYVILLVFKTYRVAWLLCQQPPTYTGFFSLLGRRQTFLAPLRHRRMQQNTKVRTGLWDVNCMYKGQ